MTRKELITKLYSVIEEEITKEQIDAVIYATAMSGLWEEFKQEAIRERRDHDKTRSYETKEKGGMYALGGFIKNLNKKYSFKDLF